jgi:Tol biopolymer transport system component
MSLSAGDKLGPYEILAPIGKGGMGEVYRAHDRRTGRDVAIKVSAERFNDRFDREVRAVAALNHPNICTLFDVGPNFLVMEYVEGESPKGPMPLDEALRIAKQIADALEEAHGKGITHRDLKPGNIKVKPDGAVKVLDFGLAKLPPASPGDPESSPTLSMTATQAGMILGTAGYMSPEQARGKPVDKRADIWAFGVVFHEMLTGRRVFAGEDVTSTLAKVIEAEPSWESIPAKVRRLLKKCLEKDPKNRLRDIGDAWELLEEEAPVALARDGGAERIWPIAAGVVVLVAAALGFGWWRSSQPAELPLIRFDVDLGADVALSSRVLGGRSVEMSPDGLRLVYVSGSEQKIFVRRLDQEKVTELPGTQGASGPFFSPDSQWIGFAIPAAGTINKISVDGGAVVKLADLPGGPRGFTGATWGEDGFIIAGQPAVGLFRIPEAGGASSLILDRKEGKVYYEQQVLPGGKAILYTTRVQTADADTASIEVMTLADRKTKTLVPGTSGHYVPSGHLLYTTRGTLFAVPFDLAKLETNGSALPIQDGIAYVGESGSARFSVSPAGHGTLLYQKGGVFSLPGINGVRGTPSTVEYLDSLGKSQPLITEPGVFTFPRISPDGRRLLLSVSDGSKNDVWVYDLQRDNIRTPLTSDGMHAVAVWGPEGRYAIFDSASGIAWVRADGSSPAPKVLVSGDRPIPWSFNARNRRLSYFTGTTSQLWTVALEEEDGQLKAGKPEQFLDSQFSAVAAAFSPDGRWLAYEAQTQGSALGRGKAKGRGRGAVGQSDEVVVRPFPPLASGRGGQAQISSGGGVAPHWSQSELFYQSGDRIKAVSYTVKGGEFVPGRTRDWATNLSPNRNALDWDVVPDGTRLIVIKPLEAPAEAKEEAVHTVVILQNFFDELRRKAPTGK